MKKNIFIKFAVLITFVAAGFSCVDDGSNPAKGKGEKRLRVSAGTSSTTSVAGDNPVGVLFTIYRDVTKPSDYNESVSMTYTLNQDRIDEYNALIEDPEETPEDSLYQLEANLYTVSGEGVSGNTITFAPGEAQKEIIVTVNVELIDFDTWLLRGWAIPFEFATDAADYKISQVSPYILSRVGVKSQYDGVWNYTGYVGRWSAAGAPLNDGLDGSPVGLTVPLVTVNANTVYFSPLWASGGLVGGVGSHVDIFVDPATNQVTLTPIGASPFPANWGPIPGKPNDYDPATKTFRINWQWAAAAGANAQGGNTTRSMSLVMTYRAVRN